MTHSALKNNIERLLKEKSWTVTDLEKRIGSGNSRHINNIFRGASKNPTIAVLQSIAQALSVEVQELLLDQVPQTEVKTGLLLECCTTVIKELELLPKAYNITYNKIFSIIKEVYDYSDKLGLSKVDANFTKWLIQKSHSPSS